MSAAAVPINRSNPIPGRGRRCTVRLHYPPSWAVRPNPMAAELERRALAWLGAHVAARIRPFAVGEMANWPFPFADEERAEVITMLMALHVAGVDSGELDSALARGMSPEWMARFAARAVGGGDHLARRRADMGTSRFIALVSYQLGWEVPGAVLADADMRAVEVAAGNCVAIGRDLFGFGGDARERAPNLLTEVMAEFGDSVGDAFKWAAQMHTRQVRDVRRHETALVARYPEHPMLTAWFDALHCMIYGFAQWHARAPKYSATQELAGWTVQIAVSPACPDPF